MERISNVEKARKICGCGNCYHNLKGSECLKDNGILCCLKPCLRNTLQAMQWKDAQLDKAFDKALEHHCNFLKKGKITQYGMDNVFAFVQNVRTLLNSEL